MTQAVATPDAKSDQEKAPPAVEGGELKRLSVSQVQTFDASQDGGCPRKWYFEKVLGKKPPETKSQAIGTEVHRQIEHYLKTGEDVLGPIARSGKHFIPTPNPELIAVEVPFNGQLKAAGIPFVGSIDLVNASGQYADEQGDLRDLGEGVVEVCDWKTSGDVAKWAKPGSALMRTVQMPGYGVFIASALPGIEQVRLSHATFQTKGAKAAAKSTVLVPVEKLIERWTTVEGVVREMKDVAHEKEIEKVPMNLSACSAFGGCPHADICPRPKEAILRGALGGTRNNMTSLMNRLSGLSATTTTATTPPAQAAAPVEPTAPAPAPKVLGGGILNRIGALASAPKAEAPAPEAPAPEVKAEPVDSRRRIPASEARVGHHYGLQFTHGVVEAAFVTRTKAGLAFAKLDGSGMVTLDETAPVIVLGQADETAALPVDAPYSGVSGPKAEGEKSEVQEALERAQAAQVASKMAQALAQAATEDDEGEIVPESFKQEEPARTEPAPVTGEEPPKRRPGRPPGAKNKKTLAREAAEAAGEIEPAKPATLAQLAETHPLAAQMAVEETTRVRAPYTNEIVEVPVSSPLAQEALTDHAPVFEQVREPHTGAVVERHPVTLPASSLTVYIDAYPVKGEAKNLDGYVQGVRKVVCDTYKVPDVRMDGNNADLKFGKWKAVLEVCVRTQPPAPGTYYLLARGNEVLEVMAQAIIEVADVAVVGR